MKLWNRFVNWVCRVWEVENHLQFNGIEGVVVMSLSPKKNGLVGLTLSPIIRTAVQFASLYNAKLIASNRYMVAGRNLCREMVAHAISLGISEGQIITPKDPEDPRIRNTFAEADFATEIVKREGLGFMNICNHSFAIPRSPRLLIVANPIHMRRVLAAFRRVAGNSVELFWVSARNSEYCSDVYQKRFYRREFFLAYEIAALVYSKLRGWA